MIQRAMAAMDEGYPAQNPHLARDQIRHPDDANKRECLYTILVGLAPPLLYRLTRP